MTLPQRRAVRQRYGLARPYALYVGTIQPRKNLVRLVAAYAKLRKQQHIEWDLVLAGGRGWLSDALYAQVEALELGERVRLLGYVPDADLPALYSSALYASVTRRFSRALACPFSKRNSKESP